MNEEPPSVDAALRAGIALFNQGYALAAHDPWEAVWLPLDGDAADPTEAADERLLHGLIAAAAATHHAQSGNWSGAVGCAENAVDYLTAVNEDHRGVDAVAARDWCRRLATDPETIERANPPSLRVEGVACGFSELELSATLLAAPALAEALDRYDELIVERAAQLAREERGTGRTTVTELLFAFLHTPDARPQVAARLADHVELADRKRRDVDDLF